MFLEKNRQRIEKEFQARKQEIPEVFSKVDHSIAACTHEVALAVKYLYAYMPDSDIGNYSFECFLDYARHGYRLYEESGEVRSLPEDIYLNYVLFHRVNEEEIRPCRSLFYEKLKDRIKGLDTKEALLEVNYWCAGEVTYQSTDERTLSALGVYQRGIGRCGEESTFMVNVLRSVGIPARQVYAPYWAHCDDNHAWVEMWCGGTWYFTGACEPQPILNMGWFLNASSRAMMIHSKKFDSPQDEKNRIGNSLAGKNQTIAILNELNRYAVVKRITVEVRDENQSPVSDAHVFFEVVNYAQFVPIAETKTDVRGCTQLYTGLGSLHIYAVSGNQGKCTGETYIDVQREDYVIIKVSDKKTGQGFEENMEYAWVCHDLIAPHDTPIHTKVPGIEQMKENDIRVNRARGLLQKKISCFTNPDREAFLTADKETRNQREKMLECLTIKDQADCSQEILEEHLQYALIYQESWKQYPEIFFSYVMNPRVENEVLSAWRRNIYEYFSEKERKVFQKDPGKIWGWMEERICSDSKREYDNLVTVPAACLQLESASIRSKKILFVAVARTFGTAARLNPATKEMEYWKEDHFVPVLEEKVCDCRLTLEADPEDSWAYFQNWSISYASDGIFHSLDFADKEWKNEQLQLSLRAGAYRILTATRLPNGSVLANVLAFDLKKKQEKQIRLEMRRADLSDMLLDIDMPDFFVRNPHGEKISGSKISDLHRCIFFWLEGNQEPTIHILNELLEHQDAYDAYQEHMIFIVRSKAVLENRNISEILRRFPKIQICFDDFDKNVEMLGRCMYVDFEKLPLIFITDRRLHCIYAQSGYNVGTGDMLLRILEAVKGKPVQGV